MKYILAFILYLGLTGACSSQKHTAEKVFINGRIWTGDSSQPWASTLVVQNDKIIYAGSEGYFSSNPGSKEMIDLGGKFVMPGFIDNHVHFLSGGMQLASVNLRNAVTKTEFIHTLSVYISHQLNNERWITGGDWDHENWGGELPNRSWIDSISGDKPVMLNRYDGHMVLCNSRTLELAGINRQSNSPEGGEIVKDKDGEPTGVLKDEAIQLVNRIMPIPDSGLLDEALQRATEHALANGVTQINDVSSFGGWTDLETYRRNYNAHKLGIRIYSFLPLETWVRLDSFVKKNGKGDNLLKWGGLKGFTDGSLGSTTAWFYKPYLDDPATAGLTLTDTALMRIWMRQADSAGLHLAIHAIGDRANDFILDVYEQISAGKNTDQRFRIEHAQHLSEEAIPRFRKLNVIPSMQPYHAIDDGRWAAKRLDNDRLSRTYAFKSLLQGGAQLTFGSDWTVAPINPLSGIYAAVTRSTLDGKNPDGWYPDQKVSVEQALHAYTSANAYASRSEHATGKLQKGMLADFVVLSSDPLKTDIHDLQKIRVLKTYLGGMEVYSFKE